MFYHPALTFTLIIILTLPVDGFYFYPNLSICQYHHQNSNINTYNIHNKRYQYHRRRRRQRQKQLRDCDINPSFQLWSTLLADESIVESNKIVITTKKDILQKVLIGSILAPTLIITPFYGIGFAVLGPDKMWSFSKWVYSFAKSSEVWLFDTFRRTLRFLSSGTQRAQKAAWAYRIHPLFAGISLISTTILSFADATKYQHIISRKGLLIANAFMCFISAISGQELASTMMGATHAKKWIKIQANTCIAFSILAISPSLLGSIMVYLNWSLLFAVGVLERLYVLCILSQFRIQDRNEYMRRYSPQFQVACLGSIPLGIITFWLRT